MRWSPTGRARQHLGVGLRRLRSRPGGTARGAVHPGQRLLRDARRGARGQSRRRALPGDVRGRLLQPPGHGGVGPVGRQRRHRERAELAPPDVPDRRRRLVRPPPARHSRLPAGARPSPRGAHPSRVLPRSCREGHARGPAAIRRHGPSARGGAGGHDRGRELVRADRGALLPRRHGDQLRRRSLPGPAGRPSRPGRAGRPGRWRDVPPGADPAVADLHRRGGPHARSGWTGGPSPTAPG